ncbi:jg27741 [Pararge aegeria aegeria]|uniref:Jg27741 protein n=1 Tax=Pararge aegeria aegeria TaxID=348720 RepID=A0A8S4S014_9NEOP|nr:jg27741 [Pararge aegeria aegeria]
MSTEPAKTRAWTLQLFLHKYGWKPSDTCDCGEEDHTMELIIRRCPIFSYQGVPNDLLISLLGKSHDNLVGLVVSMYSYGSQDTRFESRVGIRLVLGLSVIIPPRSKDIGDINPRASVSMFNINHFVFPR